MHFVRTMFGTSHFIQFMTTTKDKLSKFLMEIFSKMLGLMIPIEKSSKQIVILKETIRIWKPLRSQNSFCSTTNVRTKYMNGVQRETHAKVVHGNYSILIKVRTDFLSEMCRKVL